MTDQTPTPPASLHFPSYGLFTSRGPSLGRSSSCDFGPRCGLLGRVRKRRGHDSVDRSYAFDPRTRDVGHS